MSWSWQKLTGRDVGSCGAAIDRCVIINGDDFGLSSAVNEAVILAYRHGILRSASLMIGEVAAEEAVDSARRHPGLAVGLHIALSDSRPVLPPEQIPDLVQADGRFHANEAAISRRLLTSRAVRLQLRAEIAAQFTKFRETGLVCDHVNTHRNVHLHPVIAFAVFQAAARESIPVLRIPWQPRSGNMVWHQRSSPALNAMRYVRAMALRRLAYLYGLHTPDRSIDATGRSACLISFLSALPPGITELYLHPATANDFPGSVRGFPYLGDLAVLCHPASHRAVANLPVGGYRDALLHGSSAAPVHLPTVLVRGQ